MTEYGISIIFHYDGEVVFDIIRPVYNGGRQKMRTLPKTLTYNMLLNEAIALSNWDANIEDESMKYLHHNGLIFSLISLEDKNDMLGMLMLSGSEQDVLHVYVNRKLHVVNKKREGSRERVKVGGSSAKKKMYKRICEIKNPTPGLVYLIVDIREDVDMHFFTALDSHATDRSTRAGFDVDGIDPEAGDAHDVVCATFDISMVRGTPSRTLAGNKQGAETNNAVNHSFVMEDVNFIGNEQGAKTFHAVNHSFAMEDVNFGGNEQGAETIHAANHLLAMEDVDFVGNEQGAETIHAVNNSLAIKDINIVGNEQGAETIHAVNHSVAMGDINFVDTMAPQDVIAETGMDSAREMWIGRQFLDCESFRGTLAKFAIYNNFTLRHVSTKMKIVTARCRDDCCPWRIHASIVDSGPEFKVRTYNPRHCCSIPMMGMTHPQASSKLIEEFIEDRVRCNNHLRPKEIMNEYKKEFGTCITYRKAYIAKGMALRVVRGSHEESFKISLLYCKELHMTNPGTLTNIDTTVEDRFRRFFWAFGPYIRSFYSSMRPMIVVDGPHLRGKYPGVLIAVVTYDGNYKLFPIAFALAEAERRDSWEWLLASLALALGSPTNLTIVSDRQKGPVPALANIMPSAMLCYCCHHIAENIKTTFCDHAIVLKFWQPAKAFRLCEYEAYMNDIISVDQGVHTYINAIGKQHWSNVFVEGRRYDMITSNAAECTNALLKDIRVLLITKQVEEIRAKLMEFFQRRHLESLNITSRLTPYAEKLMSQEAEDSHLVHVHVAGLVEFQVQSAQFIGIVDLEQNKCSCCRWEIIEIPCCHALATMKVRHLNPYDYAEDCYLTTTYRASYSEVVHATRDSRQWEHTSTEIVLPPRATKQPGRPKKSWIRVEDRN